MEQDSLKKQLDLMSDPHQLELFGKTLLAEQMADLLDIIHEKYEIYNEKLSPILAGFLHENFLKLLPIMTNQQQALMQQESITIPLQHHLTILSQEKMKVFESIAKLFMSLDMIIAHLDVKEMGIEELKELFDQIHHLSISVDGEIAIINRVLLLAWNSNRIDLIEKFSLLKESLQKYKMVSIGSKERRLNGVHVEATGLYQKIMGNKLIYHHFFLANVC